MRIAVPIAAYHSGTTGEYMAKAFQNLGHDVEILGSDRFIEEYQKKTFELFFCVDSGEPLPFNKLPISGPPLAMWFIDFRHNKDRATRIPNDKQSEAEIVARGGYVFQAQYEDMLDTNSRFCGRASWLPVAADPDVWSDTPIPEAKSFHVAFIGNVWDIKRKESLEILLNLGLKVGFPGHGKVWKEAAANILRHSLIGFNISSFYGTEVAFDINMRFFETLSCGIPMVTNEVPSLSLLMPNLLGCIKTFKSLEEIAPILKEALSDQQFLQNGFLGRKYILESGTYTDRAKKALDTMKLHGLL